MLFYYTMEHSGHTNPQKIYNTALQMRMGDQILHGGIDCYIANRTSIRSNNNIITNSVIYIAVV